MENGAGRMSRDDDLNHIAFTSRSTLSYRLKWMHDKAVKARDELEAVKAENERLVKIEKAAQRLIDEVLSRRSWDEFSKAVNDLAALLMEGTQSDPRT